MSSRPPAMSVPRVAWLLIALLAAAQLCACMLGSLRADDWVNLERGRQVFSEHAAQVWTALNPFMLFRPVVDVWHGVMLKLFGLDVRPMLMMLVAQLLLQSWLLSRLVRAMGGSREAAALAALAMWAQANTYTWTTLWASNATGSLMTTFALLTLLALARVSRLAREQRSLPGGFALLLALYLVTLLCKEESVLLPGIAAALASLRWRHAGLAERRAWVAGIGAMLAFGALYAAFRTVVLPTPQAPGSRYSLSLGPHLLRNAGFLMLHLGALPLCVLAISRWMFPFAFTRAARELPQWSDARDAMVTAGLWCAIACALYPLISGRPAFGYLYAPAFAVAFGVGHGLAFAAGAQASASAPRPAWAPLAAYALFASALTAGVLIANQWPHFGTIQKEALETLHREVPQPAPGQQFVFLDAAGRETPSGRSLFSLVFEGATTSMLRLTYGRSDLQSRYVRADALHPGDLLPGAVVFSAREGRLHRLSPPR